MDANKKRSLDMRTFTNTFRSEFFNKFQIIPKVVYTDSGARDPILLDIETIETIGNIVLHRLGILGRCKDGIKTRSRIRELVLTRQCAFKLARDMKYSLVGIETYFGYDHATVLYGCRMVDNLTNIRDELALRILNIFEDVIKEINDGNDGDDELDSVQEPDT